MIFTTLVFFLLRQHVCWYYVVCKAIASLCSLGIHLLKNNIDKQFQCNIIAIFSFARLVAFDSCISKPPINRWAKQSVFPANHWPSWCQEDYLLFSAYFYCQKFRISLLLLLSNCLWAVVIRRMPISPSVQSRFSVWDNAFTWFDN